MTQFIPRPYQAMMVEHIVGKPRAALFAGMGMGKTSSTLSAIDLLRLLGEVENVLVIAPLRVAMTTWVNEAAKWDCFKHLKIVAIVGTESERRAALRSGADIFTTNYEQLPWLVKEFGDRWPFDMVVADESTRLKSFRLRQGGMRAAALGGVAHDKIKRFVALTGTPAPNGLQDLWGQVWFIDQGARLGRSFNAFASRWFTTDRSGFGVVPMGHSQREIQAAISDVCLSVDPADWFDLDEPVQNKVMVDLPRPARDLYKEVERKFFSELVDGDVTAANAAVKSMKLLQIANGAVITDSGEWKLVHDAKLDALESVIEEAAGMPVIVCYQFVSDLERLKKRFKQGREMDKSPKTLADFCAGKIPLLFLHPQSAGHGLDGMQNATNQIVFFSHWWAAEEREQAIARIGPVRQRQAGLNRPVFVHSIVARNTVDELVLARLASKQSVQQILIESMKKGLSDV